MITAPLVIMDPTVDGMKPAKQLKLVVYRIIYRVLAPSQVVIARFQPSTVLNM